MDPLTAIGLVGNVLAFIDFSVGLLKGAREIHSSPDGTLKENQSRETVVRETKRFSLLLQSHDGSPGNVEDAGISSLVRECHDISTKLLALFEKTRPEDGGSKRQSLLSALKSKIYEKDRDELEVRLAYCRGQLELQLSFLTRTETLERLGTLVAASKSDRTILESLENQVSQLRTSLEAANLSSEVCKRLETLLESKGDESVLTDRILSWLSYDQIRQRSDMVIEAHSSTFEWILKDGCTSQESLSTSSNVSSEVHEKDPENTERTRARAVFLSWLEQKDSTGVFHLAGKLGSGKSTLMKMVYKSPLTERGLKEWAGTRELAIVNFYFWISGSEYQKSLRGLYRSLLHDILKAYPTLIPYLFPQPWTWEQDDVTDEGVRDAFLRLVEDPSLYNDKCLCVFIDGLDEFQTAPDFDHRDLAELLCRWTRISAGAVKICVSSREYNVFMSAFPQDLRIRLQDLNKRDIELYIQDKLSHVKDDPDFSHLVSSITEKASGIFLWVALVVKSLRESVEDGLTCAELSSEVDILPEELNQLYRHILKNLPHSTRVRAYQTFKMMAELKKANTTRSPWEKEYRMSLISYAALDLYVRSPGFVMADSANESIDEIFQGFNPEKSIHLRKRLSGCCKGLVEAYERQHWGDYHLESHLKHSAFELDFTHRSVPEFLELPDVERTLQLLLKGFDHCNAVASLLLVDLLFDKARSFRTRDTMEALVYVGIRIGLVKPPYTFLERIRELLAIYHTRLEEAGSLDYQMIALTNWSSDPTVQVWPVRYGQDTTIWTTCAIPPCGRGEVKYICPTDPILLLGHHCQDAYVLWRVKMDHNLRQRPVSIALLAYICTLRRSTQMFPVIEALLSQGLLNLDARTVFRLDQDGIWNCFNYRGDTEGLTIWQCLVISCILRCYDPRFGQQWPANYTSNTGQLMHMLLRSKPDLRLGFSIRMETMEALDDEYCRKYSSKDGKKQCDLDSSVFPGDDKFPARLVEPVLSFTLGGNINELEFKPRYSMSMCETWTNDHFGAPKTGNIGARRRVSFRDFIEFGPLPNKDELLVLIDSQQTRGHAGLGQSESEAYLPVSDSSAVKEHGDSIVRDISSKDGMATRNNAAVDSAPLTEVSEERTTLWKHLATSYVYHVVLALLGILLAMLVRLWL